MYTVRYSIELTERAETLNVGNIVNNFIQLPFARLDITIKDLPITYMYGIVDTITNGTVQITSG